MKSRASWVPLLVSGVGTSVCVVAVLRFVIDIQRNNLVWTPDQPARDHYLAVGQSYSQGFVAGFFLCFFLTAGALALTSWRAQRARTTRRSETGTHTGHGLHGAGSPVEVEDC